VIRLFIAGVFVVRINIVFVLRGYPESGHVFVLGATLKVVMAEHALGRFI
jgi:hypothetical protein